MKELENYSRLTEILEAIPDAEVRRRKGCSLKFPIYLTEDMAVTPIEALELNQRSYNSLKRAGYSTIGDICARVRSSNDLKSIRNCGIKSIEEIMDSLFAFQYHYLRQEDRKWYLNEVVKLNC